MHAKASAVLCAICVVAQAAPKQYPLGMQASPRLDRDPITIRCGTGSNTEECPKNYKCTAPSDCEGYYKGVYYEGCIGACVPDFH